MSTPPLAALSSELIVNSDEKVLNQLPQSPRLNPLSQDDLMPASVLAILPPLHNANHIVEPPGAESLQHAAAVARRHNGDLSSQPQSFFDTVVTSQQTEDDGVRGMSKETKKNENRFLEGGASMATSSSLRDVLNADVSVDEDCATPDHRELYFAAKPPQNSSQFVSQDSTVPNAAGIQNKRRRVDNHVLLAGFEIPTQPQNPSLIQTIDRSQYIALSLPSPTSNSNTPERVRLPSPPVRKSRKSAPRIPPLLQGLHEPPPDAGLFPRITEDRSDRDVRRSNVFDAGDGGANKNYAAATKALLHPVSSVPSETAVPEDSNLPAISGESKQPVAKYKVKLLRKKWSEEETNCLLEGVKIFGVGQWKKILLHPNYNFNKRSAVDLKDRFRVCFPKVYSKDVDGRTSSLTQGLNTLGHLPANHSSPPHGNKRSSLSAILASSDLTDETDSVDSTKLDNPTVTTTISTTTHLSPTQKPPPTLYPASKHRRRRPFTPDEDAAILRGFERHGTSWHAIYADTDLGPELAGRTPLDLRDRMRTRFPERYALAGLKGREKKAESDAVADVSEPASRLVLPAPLQTTTVKPKRGLTGRRPTFQVHSSTLSETIAPTSMLNPSTTAISPSALNPSPQSSNFSVSLFDNFAISTTFTSTSTSTSKDAANPPFAPSMHAVAATEESDHEPIMLDRSIFDWADQNMASFGFTRGGSGGAASSASGQMYGSNTTTSSSGGTANTVSSVFPLEATHINPLVTWKPASGLF